VSAIVENTSRRDDLPHTAVLVRRRLVNLASVSRGGCSFQASEPLDVGEVGLLSVTVAGQVHVQLFRVARSAAVPGGERLFEAGVEFLPTPASAPSLHDFAAQLDRAQSC
jgi:hypothetical protein